MLNFTVGIELLDHRFSAGSIVPRTCCFSPTDTTIKLRLSEPRFSGLLDYSDFFSSPNFVMNIFISHDEDL